MKIPKKHEDYFHFLPKGNRKTLQDDQTKLFIMAENDLYYVEVDRGIIKNTRDGIRKCDFLCYIESDKISHLIELKGEYAAEAHKQIAATIKNIQSDSDISFLITDVNLLDAYIVSPGRQEVPRGVDDVKRQITRELAKHCKTRVKNIDSLLKFVKVVPKQKKFVENNGHVLCSNEAPIKF